MGEPAERADGEGVPRRLKRPGGKRQVMSGDDGRPPADDSAHDDAENQSDDPPTGGSDADGGRPDDGRRERDERPTSDERRRDGDDGADDATPNGGRVGDAGGTTSVGDDGVPGARTPGDDAGANPSADSGPMPNRARRTDDGEWSLLDRFLHAEQGPFMLLREVLSSVGAVVAVGLILFAVSGVWPPMVAVESGSMEPHMTRGDLVFITTEGRFMSDDATYKDTGVVTAKHGQEVGFRSFGGYGSVVVYDNPERFGPPIIHRARFWVSDGENWYSEANQQYLNADSCDELTNCPAPHAGFITKGDANPSYDQAMGISGPVKPSWINGVARVRIPFLGWIRLLFSEEFAAVVDSPGATVYVPSEVAAAAGPAGPGDVAGSPPAADARSVDHTNTSASGAHAAVRVPRRGQTGASGAASSAVSSGAASSGTGTAAV